MIDPAKVISAAIAFIKASYDFRCGPQAYRQQQADWFCKAEADLYEAVTGERDLTKAGVVLGKGIIKGRKPLKGER